MILGALLAMSLQAQTLHDDPDFAFRSSLNAAEAADCVSGRLRGKRLGANLFSLRPQMSRVFEGYVITLGPDIRMTVRPTPAGSDVALYAPRFLGQLSDYIAPCERGRSELSAATES